MASDVSNGILSGDGTRFCFICRKDASEKALCKIGAKGKETLGKWCTELGDDELSARLNVEWDNGTLSAHNSCKLGLHNASRTGKRKREDQEQSEKEESRKKKQRTCTGGAGRVFLPYKNKCILF